MAYSPSGGDKMRKITMFSNPETQIKQLNNEIPQVFRWKNSTQGKDLQLQFVGRVPPAESENSFGRSARPQCSDDFVPQKMGKSYTGMSKFHFVTYRYQGRALYHF